MQEQITIFERDIQNLLKNFLAEDDFRLTGLNSNNSSPVDLVSSAINDIYKKQLDIKIEEGLERIQIDRIVTFAQKRLDPEKFYEFIYELANICNSSGRFNLAHEIFKKINRNSINPTLKANSLVGLADIYSRKACWIQSISLLTEAESIYKAHNDKEGIANCFNMLGSISGEMGDLERAKTYFNQSLLFANELSENELNAKIEANLGIVYTILGHADEALQHFEASLEIYKQRGELKRVSELYHNIGINFFKSGSTQHAEEAFNKGIQIALENQFLGVLALLYLSKSELLISLNDIDSAKIFADKALEISHRLDDKLTIADLYKVRGIIAKKMNDSKLAESYLTISLRINIKQRNGLNIAETSEELGALYKETGKHALSSSYFSQALDYYKKNNSKENVIRIEKILGNGSVQSSTSEVGHE